MWSWDDYKEFNRIRNELFKESFSQGAYFDEDPLMKPKNAWLNGLPAVEKVETYNNRVVKVTFIDGSFTKAICSKDDVFDLDVGITICALKRLLGTNSNNATREYNQLLRNVHDVMSKNEKEKAFAKAQKEAEKAKQRKAELKKAAAKLKAREEAIDIQKQAIVRAHLEIDRYDRLDMAMEDDVK